MVQGSTGIFSFRTSDTVAFSARAAKSDVLAAAGPCTEKADCHSPIAHRNCNLFLWHAGGLRHGTPEFGCVAANKLLCTIDNHLRRVDIFERKLLRILILPVIHDVGREWIAPTLVIPISDVFAEHDGLRARNELCGLKACEQVIGRRTIGAALRSEKLDENWLDRCGRVRIQRLRWTDAAKARAERAKG